MSEILDVLTWDDQIPKLDYLLFLFLAKRVRQQENRSKVPNLPHGSNSERIEIQWIVDRWDQPNPILRVCLQLHLQLPCGIQGCDDTRFFLVFFFFFLLVFSPPPFSAFLALFL